MFASPFPFIAGDSEPTLRQKRGVPKLLFCDNGSEFTSQVMDLWAYHNRVQIDFSLDCFEK